MTTPYSMASPSIPISSSVALPDTERVYRILVAVTGSVATIKLPLLIEYLSQHAPKNASVDIRVVSTERAQHFFKRQEISVPIYTDKEEWSSWRTVADDVLHIELRKWADIMVIAPLDANTLAKLANGQCDNLVTCIARAWDVNRPVLICPAMNTHMWSHPFTKQHLDILQQQLGWHIFGPIAKRLACGDTGMGAMAEAESIAKETWSILAKTSS
ncbi:putative phosphopantothenoylcysteine decarboxylase [Syncephalis plumigaleata]|nr:putative phosphopantothenoylcysteine decarboxylase [Syncephalis plumigaleata]